MDTEWLCFVIGYCMVMFCNWMLYGFVELNWVWFVIGNYIADFVIGCCIVLMNLIGFVL